MNMNRVRVLVADDHMMFAQGLEGLLRDEFELLGTVGDGVALVEAAQRLSPDLIVVDISMPLLNGFDAVRQLKKEGSQAKIIFLTMHNDDGLVAEAFHCGGSGYVLKQSAGEELVTAIREVVQGNDYLTPLVATETVKTLIRQTERIRLTPRQREVLQLISEGWTMKEIGTRLGISTRTAESHKYEMMEALGVDNTPELIRYALKLGLVS
jgi:DNA-binding NarL/FixJ family response regulator